MTLEEGARIVAGAAAVEPDQEEGGMGGEVRGEDVQRVAVLSCGVDGPRRCLGETLRHDDDELRPQVGQRGRNGRKATLAPAVLDSGTLGVRTVTQSPVKRDLRSRQNVIG